MKKLILFLLLFPIMVFGQGKIYSTEPLRLITPTIAKPLDEQYLDWCNADSNKIIIGWEFILDESPKTGTIANSWRSYFEVFEAKHAPKDRNYIRDYPVDFSDPETVYYYWERQQKADNPQYFKPKKYISAEAIRKRIEPTFEEFVLWKKKFNKNY